MYFVVGLTFLLASSVGHSLPQLNQGQLPLGNQNGALGQNGHGFGGLGTGRGNGFLGGEIPGHNLAGTGFNGFNGFLPPQYGHRFLASAASFIPGHHNLGSGAFAYPSSDAFSVLPSLAPRGLALSNEALRYSSALSKVPGEVVSHFVNRVKNTFETLPNAFSQSGFPGRTFDLSNVAPTLSGNSGNDAAAASSLADGGARSLPNLSNVPQDVIPHIGANAVTKVVKTEIDTNNEKIHGILSDAAANKSEEGFEKVFENVAAGAAPSAAPQAQAPASLDQTLGAPLAAGNAQADAALPAAAAAPGTSATSTA